MTPPRRAAATLLVLLLLTVPVPAQQTLHASDPVAVHAVAVAPRPDGTLQGLTADVEATVLADGWGRVFVDTRPLAETDMQGATRLAAQVAAQTRGMDWQDQDYLLVFRSGSPVIGGPSAGAVTALAFTVALHNLHAPDEALRVPPDVAVTGTINPDGTLGPVGGVPEKAEGAAQAGLSRFVYPAGLEETARSTPQGARPVHMDTVCDDLGLDCLAAATLGDVLAFVTGADLERPDAPVPGTADYGDLLRPDVEGHAEDLEAALDSARARADDAPAAVRDRVADDLDAATRRLADARTALAGERYYSAATLTFQGRILAGQVEATVDLYTADDAEGVVQARLADCEAARDEAQTVAQAGDVDDWHGLYAVAAADTRAAETADLARQARQAYEEARRSSDWEASVRTSAFCVERAGTAAWWSSLADRFGPTREVDHLEDRVQDALGRATQMATYARAVLGPDPVPAATARLEAAQRFAEEGRLAAALVEAVAAEVEASVALQAGTGVVAPAVVDAAQQTASQAVARARAPGDPDGQGGPGVEPFSAVARVELADDLQGAEALRSLWMARGLALLSVEGAPPPVSVSTQVPPDLQGPASPAGLVVVFVVGVVAGVGVAGTAAILLRVRWR